MKNKNLLIVIPTITTGGAETFVLRFAQSLKKKNINVKIFALRGDLIDQKLKDSLAPDVEVFTHHTPFLTVISKIDSLLHVLGFNFFIQRFLETKKIANIIKSEKISIIHSHLATADIIVSNISQKFNIPWVTTVHGDYIGFLNTKTNRAARILDFESAFLNIQQSVSGIVCITDHQMDLMKSLMKPFGSDHKLVKIYNGYETFNKFTNKLDQIPDNGFVVGMVARGIKEKGWDVLLSSFKKANIENAWLVLVGGGDEIDRLKSENTNKHIIFVGNVTDPLNYIARFSVACLPSRYPAESLPTSIIEYMYLGKPTLATDVGEVSKMLDVDSDSPSGIIVSTTNLETTEDELTKGLIKLYQDTQLCKQLKANTKKGFEKFNMNTCIELYDQLYTKALKSGKDEGYR